MGFSTGGLIIKNGIQLSDETILAAVRREKYGYTDEISMEEAVSGDFGGTAIGRINETVIVLGRDIPHSCSFEEGDVSKMDDRLAVLSKDGDILCFLVNSVSDTYAFSIFQAGKRVRAMSTAAGMHISDFGTATGYDDAVTKDEQGMIRMIENFTGMAYIDLFFSSSNKAIAYYK